MHAENRDLAGKRSQISALLILAAILTGCIVFFRANEIVVTGQARYTAEEIIAATGVEQGQNLFRLDKAAISRQVCARLPYIDTISFSRKFPDTLLITVTESQPVAALEYEGAWWLLDARGKLLEQGDATLARGRAVLLGLTPLSPAVGSALAVEEGQEKKLNSLQALLGAMAEQNLTGHITEFIDLTSESDIRFGYDAVLTVEVPLYSGDFTLQVRRLDGALQELQERSGTVSGTLTLPAEGNRAWLSAQRWMPEAQLPEWESLPAESAPSEEPQTSPTPEESTPVESTPAESVTPMEPTQAGD